MESWSGVLEWIFDWTEVRFGVVALVDQDFVLIDQLPVRAITDLDYFGNMQK